MQEETKISNGVIKVLSFLLLIGIAVSVAQVARAESIGEFLEELLPQVIQNTVLRAEESVSQSEESIPQSEESVPIPQGFVADKSFYTNVDTIRISNTPAGSAIKIYWLDNPDTAENPDPDSRPSNVYAALVNDDGTVNIDAATLPAGRFVFVNTFEPGHCGGFYLSQCRARSDYLGEISLSINP
ncbi:MAG: hypothetical protein DDT19_02483 [Syntrophomonadaceae bacterium]|nr:hypothetical protein [Bacillota bacterium]